jgi:hypothetical protein
VSSDVVRGDLRSDISALRIINRFMPYDESPTILTREQCTYNISLRLVRVAIFGVEKQ